MIAARIQNASYVVILTSVPAPRTPPREGAPAVMLLKHTPHHVDTFHEAASQSARVQPRKGLRQHRAPHRLAAPPEHAVAAASMVPDSTDRIQCHI